jgi:hypothetical protein
VLPESLKKLSRLSGVPVWTDSNWEQHVDVLAGHLSRARARGR